jgi:HD-GYP domain-containing protein (c-di-GMP phosphodiesterase class II)
MDEHGGEKKNFWLWRERVGAILKAGSGRQFDPVLVNLVENLLKDQRFCLDLLESGNTEKIRSFRPLGSILISGDLFSVLGKAFAMFIDNKSRYTANHSQDVAHCAGNIATHLGLSEQSVRTIHLAGLLHDLGKVAIPNEILEKPGKLTEHEYGLIKSHPYYTAFILDKIPELRTVGFLASAHHERLDGSGYYLGRKGENLSLEARLIAVADVYAALAADRPYRKGMDPKEIIQIMKEMAQIRHLDADLVSIAVESL